MRTLLHFRAVWKGWSCVVLTVSLSLWTYADGTVMHSDRPDVSCVQVCRVIAVVYRCVVHVYRCCVRASLIVRRSTRMISYTTTCVLYVFVQVCCVYTGVSCVQVCRVHVYRCCVRASLIVRRSTRMISYTTTCSLLVDASMSWTRCVSGSVMRCDDVCPPTFTSLRPTDGVHCTYCNMMYQRTCYIDQANSRQCCDKILFIWYKCLLCLQLMVVFIITVDSSSAGQTDHWGASLWVDMLTVF